MSESNFFEVMNVDVLTAGEHGASRKHSKADAS